MGYKVKLSVFEGPFDLLVYLIENAQMNIYDIQISEITDQYLRYIEEMKKAEVVVAAEFMVLAAALVEIKSKMLLPGPVAPGEDPPQEDPRTELVERLMEYRRFKLLAGLLQDREADARRSREKPQEDLTLYTNEPDEYLQLDLKRFVSAFDLFLRKKKKLEEIRRHHKRSEKQKITTEVKMAGIRDFFMEHPKKETDFYELVENRKDRYDVALTFSTVLEMVKNRSLMAEQEYLYGDILVTPLEGLMEEPEPADTAELPEERGQSGNAKVQDLLERQDGKSGKIRAEKGGRISEQ